MEYRKQQFLTYDEFTRQFACDYAMPLARGGHGEIYRGVDLETNEEVAIKRRLYSVDDNALTLEKEYANTQAVPVNRFVVRYLYYGRYATPFGTYEFLVMRYYRDGNLTNTELSWATLSNLQQQRFVSEFLLGLSHLHTHGIVHRDIKPENVLLVRYSDSEGIAFRPVIVDFGISKMMTDHPEAARAFVQNSMRIGTVTYMAPEQLRTENIDYNADLWSFGIILYELITGKHMIARKSFPETQREEAYTFWRMASEEQFPDDLLTVPQPYQQIIRRCLIVSTDDRIQSARGLLDLLDLQPRIVEAELAFRQQKWDVVIDALDPIVDQAEIPELIGWLQQARMQAALSQPIERYVEEPGTLADEDVPNGLPVHIPEVTHSQPDILEPNNVPDNQPGAVSENRPVPYTAQTELLDVPAEPVSVMDAPAAESEPVRSEEADKHAAQLAEEDVPSSEPDAGLEANVTTSTTEDPTKSVDETVDNELWEANDEPAASLSEQAYTEQTETFPEEIGPAVDEPNETPNLVSETAATLIDGNIHAPVADIPHELTTTSDDLQHTEAFVDVPELVTHPAGDISPPVRPEQPAEVHTSAPSAIAKLLTTTKLHLTKPLENLDSAQVKKQVGELYDGAKKRRNRPLVIGSVVILLLALLFTIGPGQPTDGGIVQLDPNESHATALKRFHLYVATYEKTGDLNPYVWAFAHCNPAYEDSLTKAAIRRARNIIDYNQQLFPDYEGNLPIIKLAEMRYIANEETRWDSRPHNLSDENCLPQK